MIQEYKNQLTALLVVIILGGSYLFVQHGKLVEEKRLAEQKAFNKEMSDLEYNNCAKQADTDYWAYMKLNGTENTDGSVTAQTRFWDSAAKNKRDALDNCFSQYKK